MWPEFVFRKHAKINRSSAPFYQDRVSNGLAIEAKKVDSTTHRSSVATGWHELRENFRRRGKPDKEAIEPSLCNRQWSVRKSEVLPSFRAVYRPGKYLKLMNLSRPRWTFGWPGGVPKFNLGAYWKRHFIMASELSVVEKESEEDMYARPLSRPKYRSYKSTDKA